jgi:hypothetical protein
VICFICEAQACQCLSGLGPILTPTLSLCMPGLLFLESMLQVGGWDLDYADEEALAAEACNDQTLQTAFDGSRGIYLEHSNTGESRWRERSSKTYQKRAGGPSPRERSACATYGTLCFHMFIRY